MNDGQQQFLHYILECVKEGNEDKAESMLLENFEKQKDGSFSHKELRTFHKEIIKQLKPERKDEVIDVLNQFGEMHISK